MKKTGSRIGRGTDEGSILGIRQSMGILWTSMFTRTPGFSQNPTLRRRRTKDCKKKRERRGKGAPRGGEKEWQVERGDPGMSKHLL